MSAKSPPAGEQEDYPFPLTDVDRWVLSQTDEEFHYHSWDELKQIIGMLICMTDRCSSYLNTLQRTTTSPSSNAAPPTSAATFPGRLPPNPSMAPCQISSAKSASSGRPSRYPPPKQDRSSIIRIQPPSPTTRTSKSSLMTGPTALSQALCILSCG